MACYSRAEIGVEESDKGRHKRAGLFLASENGDAAFYSFVNSLGNDVKSRGNYNAGRLVVNECAYLCNTLILAALRKIVVFSLSQYLDS